MQTLEAPRVDARPSPPSRMTREQHELVSPCVPMALALAKPFGRAWPSQAVEFRSSACLALCMAGLRFDPGRGVPFKPFARRCVQLALIDLYRSFKAASRVGEASIVVGIPDEGAYHLPAWDVSADPVIAAEDLEPYLRVLSGRHRELIRLLYLDGLNQREVAQLWGSTRSRVSALYTEAIAELRQHFAEDQPCCACAGKTGNGFALSTDRAMC